MLSSWLVWGGFAGYFLAFELPPLFWDNCPWVTLSETVWDLIQRTNGIAAIALVAGLAVLAVHLVAPGVFEKKKDTKI